MKKIKFTVILAAMLILLVSCNSAENEKTGKKPETDTTYSEAENETGYTVIKSEKSAGITASVPAGIFTDDDAPKSITLSTDTGYTIKYTLSVSKNPDVSSHIADEPIKLSYLDTGDGVSKSAVIRAALFNKGEQVGNSFTFTYISAPYGRFTTPVFSLVSEPEGLYGYENGILVEGKARADALKKGNPPGWVLGNTHANFYNSGREWEREMHIEFSETGSGSFNFSSNGGVRVNGGWTRANIQKSLKLFSRKDYTPDYGTFAVDLFPGYRDPVSGRTVSFANTILLRGGSNNEGNTMISTPFQLMLCEGTEQILPAVRPVTEFINGKYKGLVFIIEDYDADFFEAHLGIPEDELAIFAGSYENYGGSMWTQDTGPESELELFNETLTNLSKLNMTVDENYKYACEVLDIRNFIEYMCIQMYCGNSDWPDNNLRAFRRYTDGFKPDAEGVYDGRYRFLLKDLDLSFGNGHSAESNPYETVSGGSTLKLKQIFAKLMKNPQFSEQVYMYMCTLSSTVFNPDRVQEMLDSFILALTPEMRYSTEKMNVAGGSVSRWQNNTNSLMSFANNRVRSVRNATFNKSKRILANLSVNISRGGTEATDAENTVKLGWYEIKDGAEVRYIINNAIPLECPEGSKISVEGGVLYSGYVVITEKDAVLNIELPENETENKANTVSGSDVVINEAAYRSYDCSFIELYNTSDADILLDGWKIGVYDSNMTSLDGYTIPAKSYLVISDNPDISDIPLGFRMSSKYTLTLKNGTETADELPLYTINRTVHSGRYPDGGEFTTLYTSELTPGESNQLLPKFSFLGGIHDGILIGSDFYSIERLPTEDGEPVIPVWLLRDYLKEYKAAYKSEIKWAIKNASETIRFSEFTDFINENMRIKASYSDSSNVIMVK